MMSVPLETLGTSKIAQGLAMMEAMNAAVIQMSKSVPKEEIGQGEFEKESFKEQGTTMNHGDAPVPSGLSALLSAVTLQLNDSKNEKFTSNGTKSSSSSKSVRLLFAED